MDMNRFEWDLMSISRLSEMRKAGRSFNEIGQILGCGKNAAVGKARRIGLPIGKPIVKNHPLYKKNAP
jgi:hypothetical protein